MESISALYPKGTVCRGLSRPDALQTRMLTLKGNLHIDCLIIFFFFRRNAFRWFLTWPKNLSMRITTELMLSVQSNVFSTKIISFALIVGISFQARGQTTHAVVHPVLSHSGILMSLAKA